MEIIKGQTYKYEKLTDNCLIEHNFLLQMAISDFLTFSGSNLWLWGAASIRQFDHIAFEVFVLLLSTITNKY